MSLTLGSLFDGIGGWQLAAIRAGVKPLWSSEIERFPLAVTKARFPDTKQLGDITKINIDEIEPVDIICAGSPCQDLSIANNERKGLSGERSGLFKIAVNIIRRMRERTNGKYPRFFVWENVCGAFSTGYDANGNKMRGADFRAVLESLTETSIPMPENNRWADAGLVQCDGVNVGWRVLNADGWGVPQRRRRIFLVASFGNDRASEILFVEKGLRGNFKKRERAKQTNTEKIKGSAGKPSSYLTPWDAQGNRVFDDKGTAPTLRRMEVNGYVLLSKKTTENKLYDVSHRFDVVRVCHEKAPTLEARMGTGGGNVPVTIEECKNRARRLMPIEVERLQGLPDNWTLINDKSCSESARFKAVGNGMAQPCADFIIRQIVGVTEK